LIFNTQQNQLTVVVVWHWVIAKDITLYADFFA